MEINAKKCVRAPFIYSFNSRTKIIYTTLVLWLKMSINNYSITLLMPWGRFALREKSAPLRVYVLDEWQRILRCANASLWHTLDMESVVETVCVQCILLYAKSFPFKNNFAFVSHCNLSVSMGSKFEHCEQCDVIFCCCVSLGRLNETRLLR